jgi:hypothetical protein
VAITAEAGRSRVAILNFIVEEMVSGRERREYVEVVNFAEAEKL